MKGETLQKFPMNQVRAIYLYGAVQLTAQAAQVCLEEGIDVAYFSPAGRFLGLLRGLPASGVDARLGQYRMFGEPGNHFWVVIREWAPAASGGKRMKRRIVKANRSPAEATTDNEDHIFPISTDRIMNPDELAYLELLDARRRSRMVAAPFPRLAKWVRSMGWEILKVPLKTEFGMAAGSCFSNVAHKVFHDGGRAEYGRMFILIPDQAIQSTSHAIWVSPDGERFDITLSESLQNQEYILFAIDPSVGERRWASPTYHCLLTANPKVKSIFALEQALEDWNAAGFVSLDLPLALDFSRLEQIVSESDMPENGRDSMVEIHLRDLLKRFPSLEMPERFRNMIIDTPPEQLT